MKAVLKKSLVLRMVSMIICLTFMFQAKAIFAEQSQDQNASPEQNITAQKQLAKSTFKAAINAATEGPAKITLLDQGTLDLPENYLFIPAKEAAAYLKAAGNYTGDDFVGMLLSKDNNSQWFITIRYIKSGFMRDGDAKEWSADKLLKSIKEGNDEVNKDRIANNFPALEIVGWIETPKYNASSRQLVWSILAKDDSPEPTVNYNTYVLGRDGYFKLDLVTGNSTIDADKQYANLMLSSLHYNDGKRYQDFAEGKDRVAEYGLAALITGVAAKKIGLIALAGVFLAKMGKLLILLPLLLWGSIKNLFQKIAKKWS